MTTALLVIHILLAFALIGIVLLQRSEGGGLGIGGGMSGLMTGRSSANLLTRLTAGLAGLQRPLPQRHPTANPLLRPPLRRQQLRPRLRRRRARPPALRRFRKGSDLDSTLLASITQGAT